jgi:hypothetical protein
MHKAGGPERGCWLMVAKDRSAISESRSAIVRIGLPDGREVV